MYLDGSLITGLGLGFGLSLFICKNSFPLRFINFLRISSSPSSQVKLSLIVRTDISMTTGKIASQCSHAAISCYSRTPKDLISIWEQYGQPKIVLKSDKPGEERLVELQKQAKKLGLVTALIKDAGRTQVPSGSATVLGIGPGPAPDIDSVVGHLRLY